MIFPCRHFEGKTSILKNIYFWLRKEVLLPIKTGRIRYNICFFIFQERNEKKELEAYGFKRIHAKSVNDWRIGRGKDKAFRRYYTAYKDNKKCFIKIGISDVTVKNEYEIMKSRKDKFFFSPSFIDGCDNFKKSAVMLAVSYIDGLESFVIPNTTEQFDNICKQFIVILNTLRRNNIIHADIHKGNLMTQNGKLILLDYGISRRLDNSENRIDYIARPGTFYQEIDGIRIYDDAYSFIQLLNTLGLPDSFKSTFSYKQIQNMIGDYCFTINTKR